MERLIVVSVACHRNKRVVAGVPPEGRVPAYNDDWQKEIGNSKKEIEEDKNVFLDSGRCVRDSNP